MPESLNRFLTRIFRFPEKEVEKYVESLIDLGYDDIQAFIEDITLDEIQQFMKASHFKRVEFFLKSIQERNKKELLKVILEEISTDTPKVWTINHDSKVESFTLKNRSLRGVSNLLTTGETDFLKTIGYENEVMFSRFDKRHHIDLATSMEILQQIGEGEASTVYLGLHTYTLALLAVKRISLDNQSAKSARLKLIGTELNVVSSISRHSLQKTYQGCDDNCTVCEGYFCQVPTGDSYASCRSSADTIPYDDIAEIYSKEGGYSKPSSYIVNFYDAYTDVHKNSNGNGNDVCLLFEYMSYGNLNRLCETGWMADDCNMAVVAYSVLSGLVELHKRRIIHRDIKMQNILVSQNGKVKLADFGIVSKLPLEPGCAAKTFTGTLSYMSPDRLQGLPYSFECDIWAFGITMMRLCNYKHCQGKSVDEQFFGRELSYWDIVESIVDGRHIKDFVNLSSNSLKPMFKDLILQCLIVDPAQRPSAETLLQHPYILENLNCYTAESVKYLLQPHLTELPLPTPSSVTKIMTIVEKVVTNLFNIHEYRKKWYAEEIWDEANRRHLAIALGCDFQFLTQLLQSELDRRCGTLKELKTEKLFSTIATTTSGSGSKAMKVSTDKPKLVVENVANNDGEVLQL